MDREAQAQGLLLNDPDNPGRVYLCGKGVTRIPADSSTEMRQLAGMRAALERRNREMTAKVAGALPGSGWMPRWTRRGSRFEALTPRGNATERHVAWGGAGAVARVGGNAGSVPFQQAIAELLWRGSAGTGADDAALQIFLRGKLLKAGAPCFVRESEEAFVSVLKSCAGSSWPSDRSPRTPSSEIRSPRASGTSELSWTDWRPRAFTRSR
jgi:hypothetical protein